MTPRGSQPPAPAAASLAYDELPQGSALRREFDGRGGVTITAPAGDVPLSVRRDVSRAGLLPASLAFGVCVVLAGALVLHQIRNNRIDPELRSVALLVLGVLATGVFLFVWLARHVTLSHALADARRQSSVLHADAERLLVEVATPAGGKSLDIPTAQILSMHVAVAPLDETRRSVPVPCLKLFLRNGTTHLLLGGHHVTELSWVAAALSEATGVPAVTAPPGWPGLWRRPEPK